MKLYLLIISVFLITNCKSKSDVELEIYDFEGFENILKKQDDTVYVINFWATWCGPCLKELPSFEKLNANYQDKNVKVILVSLDLPHLYETKLKPFIQAKELQSKVIALNVDDINSLLPKIDEAWSGSIPATLIYKNKKRKFFEQTFTYDDLEKEVNKFLDL